MFSAVIPGALSCRNGCCGTFFLGNNWIFFKTGIERLCEHFVKNLRNVLEKNIPYEVSLETIWERTLDGLRRAVNMLHATQTLFRVHLMIQEG